MSEALKEQTSSVSIYNPLQKTISLNRKQISIESYDCVTFPTMGCLEDWAEIRVTDRLMTLVVEGFKLIFKRVKINGYYAFKNTCADVSCSYCPYLTKHDDFYFDDRHNKYDEKPDWAECEDSATPFIKVDCQGSLEITNFKIYNFRLKQSSFIKTKGTISIETAIFTNISSSGTGGGFIVQTCSGCSGCSLSLTDVVVRYFNNGYEIRDDLSQSSFLSATGTETATLLACLFERSTVISTSSSAMLEFLAPRGPVSIMFTTFSYLAVDGALIYVACTDVNPQELKLNKDRISVESTTNQIDLSVLRFKHVTAQKVLEISVENKAKRISLSDLTIANSLATDSLVSLAFIGELTDAEINGGVLLGVVGGVKQPYYVQMIECSYRQITITNSYWSNYAFKSYGLVNEDLSSATVTNSGQYTGDLREFTYRFLVEDTDFYLSMLPVIDDSVPCRGTFSFDNTYYLTVTSLAFTQVTCSGNTGLEASVLTGIEVETLKSSGARNQATSSSGSILSLSAEPSSGFKADLSNFTVTDLQSKGAGALYISGLTVTMKNSAFNNIVSAYTSGLKCDQCSGVSVESTTFNDLMTVSGEGACIALNLKYVVSGVNIQDSTFSKCKVNKSQGGALYFSSSTQPVKMTLSRLKFTGGASLLSGTAMFIGTSFMMTGTSVISDCDFIDNHDSGASLVLINLGADLAMKRCRFVNNSHSVSVMRASYTLGANIVTLTDCTFINNKAAFVMEVLGKDNAAVMRLDNCTMHTNEANMMTVQFAQLEALNSTFTNGTKGILVSGASVKLVSTTISYLSSTDSSGLDLVEASSLECEDCTFTNNAGNYGTCIRVGSSSRITVRRSKFISNTGEVASVLYLINSKLPNLIQDTEIAYNQASASFTIQVFMSTLTLHRVNFHSNTARIDPSVSAQASNLTLLNCTFADQIGREAAFIVLASASAVEVTDSSFRYAQGAAIVLADSSLSMKTSNAHHVDSLALSLITATGSIISISNSQFYSLTSQGVVGCFLTATEGSIELSAVRLSLFNSTALAVRKASRLAVKDSVFEHGVCPSNCVGSLQDITTLEITDSQFRDIHAKLTSAVLEITDEADFSSDVLVKGSHFEHNSGGGALKLSVKSALVSESVFLNNTSETDGGGISALCARDSCNYTFTHNNFTLNSAKHNGGAINWLSQPSLTNNSFTNNSAAYGPDLASFGVALTIQDSDTEGKLMKEEGGQTVVVASGQRIPVTIRIELIDHYGQLVKTDNSSIGNLLAPEDNSTAVTGRTRVTAGMGVYEFNQVKAIAKPGSQVSFRITSDAIAAGDSNISLALPVTFRECRAGEALVGSSCEVCTAGFYSLEPSQSCTECPTGAVCYGGSLMVPEQGYWRSSKTTDEFMECLVPSACLGSPHIVPSLTGECSRGYRGNLCQACDNGFSRTSQDRCGECPSKGENSARLLSVLIAVVIICAVFLRSTLKTAYEPEAQHSIYLKIFANYLQLVLLVTQLSLDWPSFVLSFFKIQSYAGSVDKQILSFDCYFAAEDPQGDSYKTVYYDRLIIFSVLPLLMSAVVLAFWLSVYYFKGRRSILRKELVATAVVLFFLVHPSLVKEYFGFLSCRRLDSTDLWLASNLDIKCFDEQHSLYAFSVALPAILIWGVGVPSFILGILVKRRRSLGTLLMKCRFGFFYNGFKKTHFYWEFLILYRKILIISIVVFVGSQSIPIQALSIMLILLASLALQYWQEPYSSTALNSMELKAILVAGITIYCGLYYLAESLPEVFKVVLFCVIVLANSFFFYYFLHQLLRTLLQVLATHISLFKPFALKEDSFPTANITSANFITNSSYLDSDNSSKVCTLLPQSTAVADTVYTSQLSNLSDFYKTTSPTNPYKPRVFKNEKSTSRSVDTLAVDLDFVK
jgi:hypothetical protein